MIERFIKWLGGHWFDVIMTVIILSIIFGGGGLLYIAIVTPDTSFEAKDKIVQDCLESDRYSRKECILLASEVGDE